MSGAVPLEEDERKSLEALLGHGFAAPWRLALALTHPSLAGTGRDVGRGYERLEFLGDRVLGLIVAEWLVEHHPDEREGQLAKRLTSLVRAETCQAISESLGLDRYLRLAPGERDDRGRVKPAILADACEAVIGALYLDGGLDVARRFVRTHWAGRLADGAAPRDDPKTVLQEWALGRARGLPGYETVERSGPDHAPTFLVRVRVGADEAIASGPSKRAAEKAAALALLDKLEVGGA